MGQHESNQGRGSTDRIDVNSKKNSRKLMNSYPKKFSKLSDDRIRNNDVDKNIVKNAFSSNRFSKKFNKSHSIQLKYFKSSEQNLSRGSNEVELIVRKKLITTTTTTTMNNDLNNSISNVSSTREKSVISENECETDNKIIMQRVIDNANPDYIPYGVNTSSQNFCKNISNLPSDTEKRTTTYKKEQLEYEFRIMPKSNVKKKKKHKRSFRQDPLASSSHITTDHYENFLYRNFYCCGKKCFEMPYKGGQTTSQNMTTCYSDTTPNIESSLTESHNKINNNEICDTNVIDLQSSTSQQTNLNNREIQYTRNFSEMTGNHEIESVGCNFIKMTSSYVQIFGYKFYFNRNNHDTESDVDDIYENRKNNKSHRIFSRKSVSSLSDFKGRNAGSDARKSCDYSDDYHYSNNNPPITCIRVLRPSNDLTAVRFDSHYNIIQADNSDNTSLVCNAEIALVESISSENNPNFRIHYGQDLSNERNYI